VKKAKEKWIRARNSRRVQELLIRFTGYDYDEWLTCKQLRNALDILQAGE
jgi:hypothetical protein